MNRQEEQSSQVLQRRLLEAGIISEIKPPITDLTPYRNRRAVPILGEPISETAIRERRNGGGLLPRHQRGSQAIRPGNRHCLGASPDRTDRPAFAHRGADHAG